MDSAWFLLLSMLIQCLCSYQQRFSPSGDRELLSGDTVWVLFCLAANTNGAGGGVLAFVCFKLFLGYKEDGVGAGGYEDWSASIQRWCHCKRGSFNTFKTAFKAKKNKIYLPLCTYMYHSLFLFFLEGSCIKAAHLYSLNTKKEWSLSKHPFWSSRRKKIFKKSELSH